MVHNDVHDAFLNTLTMAKAFTRVPPRNGPCFTAYPTQFRSFPEAATAGFCKKCFVYWGVKSTVYGVLESDLGRYGSQKNFTEAHLPFTLSFIIVFNLLALFQLQSRDFSTVLVFSVDLRALNIRLGYLRKATLLLP